MQLTHEGGMESSKQKIRKNMHSLHCTLIKYRFERLKHSVFCIITTKKSALQRIAKRE